MKRARTWTINRTMQRANAVGEEEADDAGEEEATSEAEA